MYERCYIFVMAYISDLPESLSANLYKWNAEKMMHLCSDTNLFLKTADSSVCCQN